MGRFDAATADQIFTASNAAPTRQSHRTDMRSPIAPTRASEGRTVGTDERRLIALIGKAEIAPTNDS